LRDFKRIAKYLVPSILVLLLVSSVSTLFVLYPVANSGKPATNLNVGVAFCGNTTSEATLLIDRVKTYTNLFILDSGRNPISRNQTQIEEICDYAVSQGLKVIINVGTYYPQVSWFWQLKTLEGIKQRWTERWGDKFLGMYYNDEPGGIQLDGNWSGYFTWASAIQNRTGFNSTAFFRGAYMNAINALSGINAKMQAANASGSEPTDYNAEADFFVQNVIREDLGMMPLKAAGFTTFTSDYGLYWFDYLGGYDVMLAQIGWNCSLAQQIDLVKGAARMQNKDWGIILTWKYGSAPYLDTGDQMYYQMMTAYQAGAKYVVVFNYPIVEGNDYGIMNDEHFIALERFWNDVTKVRKTNTLNDVSASEVALVLPKNYGWGMRRPGDSIWGFWGPDSKSLTVGTTMGKLLAKYGVSMDIIYEDPAYPVADGGYNKVYYWNSTT
jgi:hypothetical protein